MGCFVEYGWAWNARPPAGMVSSRKAAVPSAEFVESFVIFLYGFTNMFLEHLAAWGGAWTAQDLEHVSISIMFFGGGLVSDRELPPPPTPPENGASFWRLTLRSQCGMLIESQRIRTLINTTLTIPPTIHNTPINKNNPNRTTPKTYPFSLNPFPALILLLLGLLMTSHHQTSSLSTTIHKQWGSLLVGFALARTLTYILTYIAPPQSFLPSRPPTEILASFCLISGGIIFMLSNKDTVAAMERNGVHAMFGFTLTMGVTALLMAWMIVVLAVRGWAVEKRMMLSGVARNGGV